MEKVKVFYSIENDGGGEADIVWFLLKESAKNHQENMDIGWGEPCLGMVETYIGSNIHKEALENE